MLEVLDGARAMPVQVHAHVQRAASIMVTLEGSPSTLRRLFSDEL
jgi:hypothetical protein